MFPFSEKSSYCERAGWLGWHWGWKYLWRFFFALAGFFFVMLYPLDVCFLLLLLIRRLDGAGPAWGDEGIDGMKGGYEV
jgi:hypothetical protein